MKETLDDTSRKGPLRGVTVIDISRVAAGPFCSMLLADLGATVIKVESSDEPDYGRLWGPFLGDGPERVSAYFAQYNRGKLGIKLNLKKPDGKKLLLKLVRKADILVENFRGGIMESFGLGYDILRKENPKLVYTSICGFGHTGPSSRKPAYDNTAQATGGIWSMTGYPDRPPVRVGTIIGDLSASLYAVIGTLAALREAERTGNGQHVDISQQDSIFSLTEMAVTRYIMTGQIAAPDGNNHPYVFPYGLYPCKDGYVFFGGYTDKFWRESCEMFGEPEFASDPEIDSLQKRCNREVHDRRLKPVIERWFSKYTKAELEQMAGDELPINAIKNIKEVVNDPQIAAREMVLSVKYPEGTLGMWGLPVKLSETPGNPACVAPRFGEHNAKVYKDWLGLTEEEFAELKGKGVI